MFQYVHTLISQWIEHIFECIKLLVSAMTKSDCDVVRAGGPGDGYIHVITSQEQMYVLSIYREL